MAAPAWLCFIALAGCTQKVKGKTAASLVASPHSTAAACFPSPLPAGYTKKVKGRTVVSIVASRYISCFFPPCRLHEEGERQNSGGAAGHAGGHEGEQLVLCGTRMVYMHGATVLQECRGCRLCICFAELLLCVRHRPGPVRSAVPSRASHSISSPHLPSLCRATSIASSKGSVSASPAARRAAADGHALELSPPDLPHTNLTVP